MLAPGSKFGDYLIEEVIGAGAMGWFIAPSIPGCTALSPLS